MCSTTDQENWWKLRFKTSLVTNPLLGFGLGFGVFAGSSWLGWFGVAVAVAAIAAAIFVYRQRQLGFAFGFAFGFGYFLPLLSWLDVVGVDALLALTTLCAGWWGLSFLLLRKLNASAAWVIASSLTSIELLRDRFPWSGFGWGQISIIVVDVPWFNLVIPWLGQVAITWLIYFLAATIANRFVDGNSANFKRILVAFLVVPIIGFLPLPAAMAQETPSDFTIGIVQGGVLNYGLGTSGPFAVVYNKHLEITKRDQAKLQGVDLLVWPESAIDLDLNKHPEIQNELKQLAAQLETSILVNSVVEVSADKVSNSSFLITATDVLPVYQKQRLVPFGEFLPLRDFVTSLTSRAGLMPRDFVPGTEKQPKLLTDLQLVICFEIADDQIAAIQQPGRALIVQTNNATYQNSTQSPQQFKITRFRAAELGTPILSVATSGISGIIGSRGEVIDVIEPGERGSLVYQTPDKLVQTPARLVSLWIPWLVLGLMLVATAQRIRSRK